MPLNLPQLILSDSISGPKKVPVARQTGRLESPNSVTDCRLPTAEHHDTLDDASIRGRIRRLWVSKLVPVRLVVMIA